MFQRESLTLYFQKRYLKIFSTNEWKATVEITILNKSFLALKLMASLKQGHPYFLKPHGSINTYYETPWFYKLFRRFDFFEMRIFLLSYANK